MKTVIFLDFPAAKLGTYRCIKSSKKVHPLIREPLEFKMPGYYCKMLWGFKPVIDMDNGNNALLIFETNLEK